MTSSIENKIKEIQENNIKSIKTVSGSNGKDDLSASGKQSFKITLTPEQELAASYGIGTRAVVATAGSGKTTTQSERIRRLMDDHGVKDKDILATTFTNAGASDLKARIDSMSGRKTGIQSGTLHSFCVKLLLKHSRHLGYSSAATILDPSQQATFLDQIMLQVTGLSSKKDITQFSTEDVKRWLGELDVREFTQDERDFNPWTIGKKTPTAVFEICKQYKARCKQFGYLDFDSILTECLRLLRLEIPSVIGELPKHVFIDEAQDLSAIQWFIVEELSKHAVSLDVIGDDDQSIYQWRGALPWRFRNFVEKADKKYFLSANRRCAQGIVKIAAQIIGVIPSHRRVNKDLSAAREEKGVIRFSVLKNNESIILVAKKIKDEVESLKKSYGDYAFIARSTTSTFPAIEGALKKLQIPYKILGGKSTFDKPEARLLRSIGNIVLSKDGVSEPFAHWQTLMSDLGVTPVALDKILKDAKASGGSFKSIEWAIKSSQIKSHKATLDKLLPEIVALRKIERPTVRHLFSNEGTYETITGLIYSRAEAEIKARQKKEGGITDAAAELMTNDLFKGRLDSLNIAMQGYLDEHLAVAMISMDVGRQEENDDGAPKVTISTAHSSKGLEWDTVFVMEVNASSWPSGQAGKGLKDAPVHVHQDVQDEERRLLYVAITRAKNELYMLSTSTHPISREQQIPSIFLPAWLKARVARVFVNTKNLNETQGIAITEPFE